MCVIFFQFIHFKYIQVNKMSRLPQILAEFHLPGERIECTLEQHQKETQGTTRWKVLITTNPAHKDKDSLNSFSLKWNLLLLPK